MRLWRRQREIYRYWDGQRWRWADPLDLLLQLQAAAIDWEEAFASAQQGDRESLERILATLQQVFHTSRFDGDTTRGLTLAEHIDLVTDFTRWLDALKKKHSGGRMSSLRMVLMPSDTSADAQSVPTNSGSASISTPTA